MCGRFALDLSPEDFEAFFHVAHPLSAPGKPRHNIAPTQEVLVVANVPGSGPRAGRMQWGFFPADTPPGKRPPLLINARAETVHRLPTFRTAFAKAHRCLIPASGWYEWQRLPDGRKQPMLIRRKDARPLAFAGLWSVHRPPAAPDANPPATADAPVARRTVIITSAALPSIASIHDRMPLALDESRWDEWLTRREPALPAGWLGRAHDDIAADDPFFATPVSARINSSRQDDPACAQPATNPL